MSDDILSSLFSSGNQDKAPASSQPEVGPPTSATEPKSSSSGEDVFSDLFSGGQPPANTSSPSVSGEPPSVSTTNSSDSGGSVFSSLFGQGNVPSSSPNNGQPAPVPPAQDENQPWYKKAFDWADTPLVDFNHAMSPEGAIGHAFGRTSEAGGFERGVENIVSGLTSPLSVALTAGTFGTGGLLESAGATALKEAGGEFAENLPQIMKAAKIATDAYKEGNAADPVIKAALEAGGHDLDLVRRGEQVFSPLNKLTELGSDAEQSVLSKQGLSQEEKAALDKGELSADARNEIAEKNGGFTDEQLKALKAAGDEAKKAQVGFTPVDDAIKAAGVDPALWNRAQKFLYDNGLTEHSLLGGDFLDRGAFQILRKTAPGWSIATTARAAETAKSIMSAGFTFQQLESASAMSPRFLDAIEEGDKDKAWEYGTEMFASGAFGIVGASHALHSAGELFKPLIENDAFRPNDQWLAIDRANKEREALHAEGDQQSINLDKAVRDILGHTNPGFLESVFGGSKEAAAQKNLELATVFHQIVTGGDRVKAAQWYNALSEALGREDRLPVPGESGPNNGQLPPAPNGDVQKLAESYTASAGVAKSPYEGLMSVDPEAAKKVADAYEAMKHNPDDPKTKEAYDALIRETKAQWDAAKAAGYKLEPWTEPGQPYANSRDMAEDVRNNKHLFYFQGGDIPEGHPLGGVDPQTGETYNNIFRAVHDLFGHAKNGYEFGPRGEENAFLAHSRMYSDEAIPALLTETKGQNSWVNFGGHLRDENGNLPRRGESGYVLPAERPYAEQKAGILPPEIVNQHLSKEPVLGQPIETPTREGTKVIHSNDAGEVRVGADGRPVVWLSPEAFETYSKAVHPSTRFSGVSYSPKEAIDAAKLLVRAGGKQADQVLDLFQEAHGASKQKLLTPIRKGADVQVVSEELGHTWQRELSNLGDIETHLKPSQWSKLSGIIPQEWTKDMDSLGYRDDPATRVAETAMQFMSGKAKGIIPDTDITRFLDAYYKEVEATHGPKALESLHKINDIAAKHVGDIDAQQARANATAENRVANERTNRAALPGVEAGRQARPAESRAGEPEGLTSREEEKEFGKLSRLRLRGGMGDPGSAGLVTGDNEVYVGRYHDDLARKAGYKEPSKGPGNIHDAFFRDGGVRIRGAGGVIHIDFMEPNADTWGRVYQAVRSVPDANKYYVDFRPIKNGLGFNISAYDKDNLLYQLKDLEEGNERPVRPGSVAAFRQGLFSRNYGVQETEDPEKFYDAVNKAKEAHAEQGTDKQLAVYSPKEYADMKTFLSPDGKTGFALKGDDIVSVFSHPTGTPGAAAHLLDVAVKNGGRRLDAFDTYLPKVYAREGFRVVARMPWNDAHAPEGWDYKAMKQYNNGRPDVVFMAFDPAHASASGGKLVGSYAEAENLQKAAEEPELAGALFSKDRENQAPSWYLKSTGLINQRMQGPMPADTVLKMLENNGVKPDELKYTGLADLLREKGQEKVSPDEVKKFLDANNLQIKEVTHGGSQPGSSEADKIRDAFDSATDSFRSRLRTVFGEDKAESLIDKLDSRAARGLTEDEAVADFSGEFKQQARELFRLNNQANSLPWEESTGKNRKNPDTKFGTYQLPGGQNYREMLLTLPEGTKQPWGREIQYVPAAGRWELRDRGSVVGSYETSTEAEYGAKNKWGENWRQVNTGGSDPNFRSGHWDEPNVVGHVRFNDRTGPNGEKLLHLEELQSDWHQKGRASGYRGETKTLDDAKKFFGISDEAWKSMPASQRQSYFDEMNSNEEHIRQGKRGMVPDAPFKKTWPELLMKRMIRYASENGYDGISWTPGEEQAARYDLSKQVNSILYNPDTEKLFAVDSNGRGIDQDVPPEKLPDVIGKEASQRLLRSPRSSEGNHKLEGEDLKVGGEGMKGFYDKIVPEVANKLGKQFGAKVQSTKIKTDNIPGGTRAGVYETVMNDARLGEMPLYAEFDSNGNLVSVAGDKDVLHNPVQVARENGDILTQNFPAKTSEKSVPYFPITDSMRESVMKQGQPLFAKESPNNGQDPQLAHQIDTNVFKNQPKDYQDLVMESLRRNAAGELSDREIAASKKLREEDGRNYEIGSANDLIHTFLKDHLHRIYEEDNPKGKVILSNAKAGKFATNVSQARQQVYDSQLTALLKSPKKIMLDPIKAVSMDRGDIIKAAANRQLIDNLRDKFTRASDGRPAVVLPGSGQVVSGQNGEDPRIFVDPSRVRKINIDPKVIQQMSTSGDLDKYLADGTIRDITPYVRPNNIGAAIDRLEEQATKSTPAPDEHGQNPLRTQIMLLKSMQANGDFSGLKDFNDALEKKYAWDPQDYASLANNAMKGWNFITNSPDGTPVYVRSDIKVHPEFAEYLQNRLGLKESDISKNPVGNALLGAGTKLKHTLLSLSPFHMVQEALRGIMVGVNPFHITGPDILTGERIDPSDPNSPTIIRKAVENGFTTGTDYKSLQEHSEGLSSGGGILDKIPGVGKVIGNSLNWYQDFLFKRYIPALKARSVELMYHEYQRLHPDWSVDRTAKAAALHANDTFGGINWKAMGRSATTQDWGRLMFLAPDWLESEMRSGARLFNKDEGGLGRAQVAKMALGLWGIARVLNLVTTGNAHYEAPFGLATKNKEGKETVFSIRTLPTDLLSAASDPVRFIKGRLSPTFRAGQELASGRDQFDRKLQPSDLWVDVFRNMSPIPLQAVGQAISGTGPEIGNIGQAVKAVGGTAQTYRTPAQKMAADLAADHTESGPIDPAQMARHHRILQLEDQARAGEISWPDLYKLTYATDQLHPDELKKIETNVKDTKGMDPGTAALYSRASRLPASDYLSLYDQMNNSERAALAPLTLKVQKRYLNKAKKDETPEERQRDPVFQRLLHLIPMRPTGPQ